MKIKIFVTILLIAFILTSCSGKGLDREQNEYSDQYRNYYEIFVGSFYDSNDDGIGDLKGVILKLDYIEALGAEGIWLMPIMPSPSYHKYDVTDYYNVDPQYGTLADFDELIQKAHSKDIKVIIDFVVNHTSDKIPWFTKAVRGLWDQTDNEYSDYYVFTTEDKGSGFTKITDTHYYESRFYSGMPDLNLDSINVREEILNIAKFWIDHGVDGFRLDAVTSYYTGNNTKNIEFMKWLNDSVKAYKEDIYFVGEAWTGSGAIAEFYASGIDSFFNFPFSQVEGTIVSSMNTKKGKYLAQAMKSWNDTIRNANDSAIDAPFLSNHDNARSAGFLMRNSTKQKMAASLYLLIPGNPFIYYGEEIGMNGSGNDPNKRLPMLWSTDEPAGIPDPPPGADQTVSGIEGVDTQLKNKNSLLRFYQSVLAIKKRFPEIARGQMTVLDTEHNEISAYCMTFNDNTVAIFHNVSDTELSVDLALLKMDTIKIQTSLLCEAKSKSPRIKKGKLVLPPYSTTILQ